MSLLIVFLLIWTLSPGPIAALTLDRARRFGQVSGIAVALGATLSTALILAAVIAAYLFGYSLILDDGTSKAAEQLGAAFIVVYGLFLGGKAVRTTLGSEQTSTPMSVQYLSFLQGIMIVIASIPQSIIFYVVLVPQAVDPAMLLPTIICLGTIKVGLIFCVHAALAIIATRAQPWLDAPFVSKGLDVLMASLLVFFGITILL